MSPPGRALLILRCASLWMLVAPSLFAQEPARGVTFKMFGCDGLDREEVRRIVALEIAPALALSVDDEPSELRATVQCSDTRAQVEVAHGSELPLELDLDFDRVPKASRARLLALAVAELLATREIESQGGDPEPEPEATMSVAPPRSLSVPRTFGWWLSPGMTWLPTPGAVLVGGNLGVWAQSGPVVFLGDVEARVGGKRQSQSEVSVSAYSVVFGFSPRLTWRDWDFTAGPGARVGWAQLSASSQRESVEGRSLGGMWWGPALAASLKWRFASWLAFHGGAEVGSVMRSVRGLDEDARALFALDGPWVQATIGLGGVH